MRGSKGAPCNYKKCGGKHYGLGLCKKHYTWARFAGELPSSKKCSVDDCDNPSTARTYCLKHYTRVLRNGTVYLDRDR